MIVKDIHKKPRYAVIKKHTIKKLLTKDTENIKLFTY